MSVQGGATPRRGSLGPAVAMGAKQCPPARQRQLGLAKWLALMASAVFAAVVVTRPSAQPPPGWQRLGDAGGSLEGGDWQGLSREEAAARAAAKAAETTEQLLSVLQGRPACVAAATTSPVVVHGWVRKAGALPMSLLDGPTTKERHQAYYRWRDLGDASTQTKEVLVDGKPGESSQSFHLRPLECHMLLRPTARPQGGLPASRPHASACSPPMRQPLFPQSLQSEWACRRRCSPTAACW